MFTLVAALDSGYSVNSTISGAPAPENMKKQWGVKTKGQYPQDCPTKGMVDLGKALAQSNNCAFMRMQGAVGFDKVKDTAVKLGITEAGLDPGQVEPACFTIGCDALVKPLDMALAYATIANDGRRNPAHFVAKVEDRSGKVLFEYTPPNEQVVPVDVARQAVIAMQKVVTGGTYSAGALPQGRPAAGKTGTTELEGGKNTDVWFVGFTPQVSTAVWIGNPAANTNMKGGKVQGGATAARVWKAFMAPYHDGMPVVRFEAPDRLPKAATVPDPWKAQPKSSKSSKKSGSSSSSSSSNSGPVPVRVPAGASPSGHPPVGLHDPARGHRQRVVVEAAEQGTASILNLPTGQRPRPPHSSSSEMPWIVRLAGWDPAPMATAVFPPGSGGKVSPARRVPGGQVHTPSGSVHQAVPVSSDRSRSDEPMRTWPTVGEALNRVRSACSEALRRPVAYPSAVTPEVSPLPRGEGGSTAPRTGTPGPSRAHSSPHWRRPAWLATRR